MRLGKRTGQPADAVNAAARFRGFYTFPAAN